MKSVRLKERRAGIQEGEDKKQKGDGGGLSDGLGIIGGRSVRKLIWEAREGKIQRMFGTDDKFSSFFRHLFKKMLKLDFLDENEKPAPPRFVETDGRQTLETGLHLW